jgi:putative aminophosphonate oxidoreductase
VTPRSLWLEEALAGDEPAAEPLAGAVRADVCVVGGGYTGLWTALALRERDPSLDVVVLEADVCGGGASGRNGGFVLSWWAKFKTLKALFGATEARRLGAASADAVVEIGRFCEREGIDAHFRQDGWLWTATNRAQVGAWQATLGELAREGLGPFRELDGEEATRRAGSRAHLAGVFEATAATVQPALLARGLRRVALGRGVRIRECSPMTSLSRDRSPVVRTPSGTVRADRVVLATNAWAVAFRELRRSLVVIASDMVATEPFPERLEAEGWQGGLAISDSRLLVNYFRATQDGRVAFGRGGGTLAFGGRVGRAFDGESPRADDVAAAFSSLYPQFRDVGISSSWTGPIDRSVTSLPFFGRLGGREDVVYGVGFSGNGVGPSLLGGRILASLALGLDDEWAGSPLARGPVSRFPPEPARYLGGHVVRAAVARKEQREDEGRRPGRLTRALASLAPAGLVPVRDRP